VDCKKVVEFCDPRIQQIKSMMGELLNFKITHHSLNMYGICGNCQKKREMEAAGKNVIENKQYKKYQDENETKDGVLVIYLEGNLLGEHTNARLWK